MSKSSGKVDESVLNVLLAGLPAHNAGLSIGFKTGSHLMFTVVWREK